MSSIRIRIEWAVIGATIFTPVFKDVEAEVPTAVKQRIPEWAAGSSITVNDEKIADLDKSQASSYFSVDLEKLDGAGIELLLEMPVRLTVAHSYLEETIN